MALVFADWLSPEAIRRDLTQGGLAAKHGVHHTMIAALKRQAVDGMATTVSGAGDATKLGSGTALKKLHAKIGHVVIERGNFGPDLIGDLPPLCPGGAGIIPGECRGDESRNDPAALLAGMGEGIAHDVDPTHLGAGYRRTPGAQARVHARARRGNR